MSLASGEISCYLVASWALVLDSSGSWHSPAPSSQKHSLHGHRALLQQDFPSPWSPISFQVALKKMPLCKRNRKDLAVNEIRIMKENRHPNIVNYIDRWVLLVLSWECSFTHCEPKVKKPLWALVEHGALSYFSIHLQWMGGDGLGSPLIFSGVCSWKPLFKNLDMLCLTKTCQFITSVLFWGLVLSSWSYFLYLNDKCW